MELIDYRLGEAVGEKAKLVVGAEVVEVENGDALGIECVRIGSAPGSSESITPRAPGCSHDGKSQHRSDADRGKAAVFPSS